MNLKIFNQPFLIFGLVFLVYFFSNPLLKDHYKHQVYLANSLIHGHFNLIDYPSFYHDIFSYQGKLYTAFTPFPILFMIPFVLLFKANASQVLEAIIIGALNPVVLYFILKKLKLSLNTIILTVIAFSLGTLNWYSAVIATSWFFSHTVAVFCLLLSLLALFNKKMFLAGLFFSLAFSSRFTVIAALPAMIWLIINVKNTSRIKNTWEVSAYFTSQVKILTLFLIGLIPGILLIFTYNYFRFGNIFETGYQYANSFYLAGKSAWQFSLIYLPRNLYIFLFKGFNYINKFPFLKPDPQGLSILLTSPFLLYAFKAEKNKLIFPLWSAVFLVSLVTFTYFLTGWYQFGYRFLLDFLPFLIILTALGLEKNKANLPKYLLISLSIVFNLLGVYWGRTLGW